jgi:hypothetical protein
MQALIFQMYFRECLRYQIITLITFIYAADYLKLLEIPPFPLLLSLTLLYLISWRLNAMISHYLPPTCQLDHWRTTYSTHMMTLIIIRGTSPRFSALQAECHQDHYSYIKCRLLKSSHRQLVWARPKPFIFHIGLHASLYGWIHALRQYAIGHAFSFRDTDASDNDIKAAGNQLQWHSLPATQFERGDKLFPRHFIRFSPHSAQAAFHNSAKCQTTDSRAKRTPPPTAQQRAITTYGHAYFTAITTRPTMIRVNINIEYAYRM